MAEAGSIDGGRIAARQLRAAGIDTVFGVVAGPMIQVFAGAQAEGLRVVGCRHEESAGFMASAWGYQKKKPGVLVVGSGPALTNALTPLYVATASAMPLVVLGGSAFGGTLGLGAFQELDQLALAKPACKWSGQVDRTDRIAEWIHLALGKAVEGRPGGVYLDFPGHLVGKRVPEEQVALRSAPEVTRPWPDPDAIARTADLLESASRPLLLVGNKLDLGQRVPTQWAEVLLKHMRGHDHGVVSAKTGERVSWAFETLGPVFGPGLSEPIPLGNEKLSNHIPKKMGSGFSRNRFSSQRTKPGANILCRVLLAGPDEINRVILPGRTFTAVKASAS